MAVLCFALSVIYAGIYLLANNIFDGIVMVLAYSFLPLFLYLAVYTFITELVCGYTYAGLENMTFDAGWFSPILMSARCMDAAIKGPFDQWLYLGLIILWTGLGLYGLYRNFIKRKAERADQLSSEFFAYPFIIHVYCLLCLLCFATLTARGGFFEALFYYALLLLIYIVATFVYKRKIQIHWKYLVFYAAAVLLTIGLAKAALATRGFGMADRYSLNHGDSLVYSWNYFGYSFNPAVSEDADRDEYEPYENYSINVYVEIPTNKIHENQEVVDIFENIRKESIDYYYLKPEEKTSNADSGYLLVYNHKGNDSSHHYEYRVPRRLYDKELAIIHEQGYEIVFIVDGNEYTYEEYLEWEGN